MDEGVNPDKVRCIRSALDPSSFEAPPDRAGLLDVFGWPDTGGIVGMAAQFIPRKGHDTLLRAVPSILRDHPGTRFLLFGKGPLHQEMSRRVRETGLEDAVHFPGFRKDLPALLPSLDLLVHPATMEGLGIILLQAAASSLPVVATAAGGIPEAVVDGETGFLVPPENPEALAKAVSALLADPALARAMGEAARNRVLREFSVSRMVEGNLAVYQELVGESPKP
jgi:glycosyltransferase involved in cell wall biosynthesis